MLPKSPVFHQSKHIERQIRNPKLPWSHHLAQLIFLISTFSLSNKFANIFCAPQPPALCPTTCFCSSAFTNPYPDSPQLSTESRHAAFWFLCPIWTQQQHSWKVNQWCFQLHLYLVFHMPLRPDGNWIFYWRSCWVEGGSWAMVYLNPSVITFDLYIHLLGLSSFVVMDFSALEHLYIQLSIQNHIVIAFIHHFIPSMKEIPFKIFLCNQEPPTCHRKSWLLL